MTIEPTNISNQAPEEVDYDNTFSNPDASDFPSRAKYSDVDANISDQNDTNDDEYEEFDNSILNPLTGDFNNNADIGTIDNSSE